jgi:5-carboxymethyl-2-hydroxymuconate isomerase
MPHFTMDYSANLDRTVDFDTLCGVVHAEILKTGLFEVGAVRVRAVRCEAYAIADLLAENAFIDMSFRIGEGRSEDCADAGNPRDRSCAQLEEKRHSSASSQNKQLGSPARIQTQQTAKRGTAASRPTLQDQQYWRKNVDIRKQHCKSGGLSGPLP